MKGAVLVGWALTLGACVEELSVGAVKADAGTSPLCQAAYPQPVVMTTPDEQLFVGGVQRTDGSIVAAEVVRASSKTFSRLLSLDTKGLTGKLDVMLDSGAQQEAVVLIADGDGWALAGNTLGKDSDIWFVRVSAAGVPQATSVDLGGSESVYGLAKLANSYLVSGQRSGVGLTSAFFAVLDNKGSCVKNCTAQYTGGAGSNSSSGNAIALLPGGDFLLAGESIPAKGNGGLDAAIWRIGADFKEQAFVAHGGAGEDWFWGIQAASVPSQGWLAFGQRNGEGWIIAVDAYGKELWQRTLPATKDVLSVAAIAQGWAIGAKTAGGQRLLGIDPLGNILWQQNHLGKPYSVLERPQGFALVGDLQGDARVLFTDQWGHAECSAGGLCAGVLTCDDKLPCTDDVCTAKAGCVHSQAAAGQPCDDGQPCTGPDSCTGGKCTSTPLAGCGG